VLGDNDLAVGHGELVLESEDTIRLARFAIVPALRGRGLGRDLLALLTDKARERGAHALTVAVHPDNANAILSYRTFGFEVSESPTSAGRISMELSLNEERPA
jgi:ribosomal protein S18 acetylase RimI-like enzyme